MLADDGPAVLPRSANKLLQAVGLLQAGWRPSNERDLAIGCASHSGEPGHLDAVRRVLGPLPVTALGCPAELPTGEAAARAVLAAGGGPSPLTMNCSGKHAAMLATCAANGWPVAGYLEPDHPVQRAVLAGVEQLAGEPVPHVVVDGCGAPQHALPLTALARAFRSLALAEPGSAAHRVAAAVRAEPWLIGGTGRDVTELMTAVPGLLAKDGAEGVYAAALPSGAAVAVKVEDGAARARLPALLAGLRAVADLSGAALPGVDEQALADLAEPVVLGGGRPVGVVRVSPG